MSGLCKICGIRKRRQKGRHADGTIKYATKCHKCSGNYKRNDRNKRPYLKYKKAACDFCGFVPVHSCQLDVDHIDGNHTNNSMDNLQTLCANCHRLKTYLNKDWT